MFDADFAHEVDEFEEGGESISGRGLCVGGDKKLWRGGLFGELGESKFELIDRDGLSVEKEGALLVDRNARDVDILGDFACCELGQRDRKNLRAHGDDHGVDKESEQQKDDIHEGCQFESWFVVGVLGASWHSLIILVMKERWR